MRNRVPLLCCLVLAAAGLGPVCGPSELTIREPAAGADVTDPSFDVVVEIHPDADVASLSVLLNGQPLALTGGPTVFTAHLQPGPPLREDNELIASVDVPAGGTTVTRTSSFAYRPPRALARRIVEASELLTGPLAQGRIGDFLLANDEARFVVQDALPLQPDGNAGRDLHSVGTYGGNLVDAELVGHGGQESFFEVQPAVNATTVIDAQTVEIVNDGQDGRPAVVRSCGPDDLIDYINAAAVVADFGLQLPPSVRDVDHDLVGCTEYSLAPGDRHVTMTTTIYNNEPAPLTLVIGDYINGMGALEPYFQLSDGADFEGAGIGEPTTSDMSVLSYHGFGDNEGVSYAYVPIELPVPGAFPTSHFGESGVDFVLTSNNVVVFLLLGQSFFQVPAQIAGVPGENSWERLFGVGDGSIANGIDLMNRARGFPTGVVEGRVTVAGKPVAGTRVALGVRDATNPARLDTIVTHWVTGEDGRYSGTVPPGDYGVIAGREGTPYQGGGPDPQMNAVTVTAGSTVTLPDIDLPPPGLVRVTVADGAGQRIPARITMVGFDPSPEPGRLAGGIQGLTGPFLAGFLNDIGKDALAFGVARVIYANAGGVAEFFMEPGDYELVVSRGTEYSSYRLPVTVVAGQQLDVAARIAQVVDSPGFVSSDFHVHAINSPDSRISLTRRTSQFAGEGVDDIIMTDHDAHTDLRPVIAQLGLEQFVTGTIGEEITTFDTGHFNGYPFTRDPDRPSGGSTDWAGAAPPGDDFPSKGSFNLTPAEIDAEARSESTSTPDTVVQVNHIDSHFSPLKIDSSAVPPFAFLNAQDRTLHRFDPTSTANLFHHFAALELWNGSTRGAQGEFLDGRIGIWMNHLNQGLRTTAIADTDTHTYLDVRSGGARTWTAASAGRDAPATMLSSEVARSVAAGRAVGGQGLYVQARLLARDGSGAVADFGSQGSTLVRSDAADGVDLEIRVQAPTWARFDTIEIYRNAATVPTSFANVDPSFGRPGNRVPVLFTATPTLVLKEGDCDPATAGDGDFDVSVVDVAPQVPGARRLETTVVVPFRSGSPQPATELDEDSWFAVVVKGSDGVCPPMFPEMPSNLSSSSNATLADLLDGNVGEGGVMALGFTNALYADVDGTAGFQSPLGPPAP